MKLRHFYKINHNNKQPIPGSNIKRKSSPGRFWKEILDPCCNPTDIDCTCGPRFFVQIDGLGKPVPGSLIKRFTFPKMEQGIKYMELPWKSECCVPEVPPTYSLTFGFLTNGEDSLFQLYLDGGLASNSSSDIPPITYNNLSEGLEILVTVTNNGEGGLAGLNISGGTTYVNEEEGTVSHLFNLVGDTTIEGYTNPAE